MGVMKRYLSKSLLREEWVLQVVTNLVEMKFINMFLEKIICNLKLLTKLTVSYA